MVYSPPRRRHSHVSLVRALIRFCGQCCRSNFVGGDISHNLVNVIVVAECDGQRIVDLNFRGGGVHKVIFFTSETPNLKHVDVDSHCSEGIISARFGSGIHGHGGTFLLMFLLAQRHSLEPHALVKRSGFWVKRFHGLLGLFWGVMKLKLVCTLIWEWRMKRGNYEIFRSSHMKLH